MLNRLFNVFGRGEELPTFDVTHVLNDKDSKTRDEALQFIAQAMFKHGYVNDANKFLSDLISRETKDSTGFKDAIATPHAKSKHAKYASIWVVRFNHPIEWETMDEVPVKAIVALSIPAKSAESAMMPLIAISKANMKEEFRQVLKTGEESVVAKEIERVIGEVL